MNPLCYWSRGPRPYSGHTAYIFRAVIFWKCVTFWTCGMHGGHKLPYRTSNKKFKRIDHLGDLSIDGCALVTQS
jgi:hypothetical protein